MKQYPSISHTIIKGQPFYVFNKEDGSNIRTEWSKKNHFYKFGTRTRLLDPNEKPFGQAIPLIMEQEELVSNILNKNKIESAVLFFEFFGPNSFAGNHQEDDNLQVKLIDVSVYKKGLLEPKEYIKLFEEVPHAELLHIGNITHDLVSEVQTGTFPGMAFEGVVCKAKNPKKPGLPFMFKLKSQAWYDKLKDYCKNDKNLFESLK